MNEQDKRQIATARRLYAGEASERSVLAPDIVWHVPGHNPVSGEYRGADYFNVMPARMAPLSRWDFTLENVMPNGSYVVATFRVQGERKGKQIDMRGAHILRFNAAGQIAEGWGFTDDQDALDAFFAA